MSGRDPYENKELLGAMLLDAAGLTPPEDLARLHRIIACERFVSALADSGCTITRISAISDRSGLAEGGKRDWQSEVCGIRSVNGCCGRPCRSVRSLR
ncbi:hypothetical protein SEA_PHATLOUIE_53 [Mycobacterium phage PhatLouie]